MTKNNDNTNSVPSTDENPSQSIQHLTIYQSLQEDDDFRSFFVDFEKKLLLHSILDQLIIREKKEHRHELLNYVVSHKKITPNIFLFYRLSPEDKIRSYWKNKDLRELFDYVLSTEEGNFLVYQ